MCGSGVGVPSVPRRLGASRGQLSLAGRVSHPGLGPQGAEPGGQKHTLRTSGLAWFVWPATDRRELAPLWASLLSSCVGMVMEPAS